MEERTITSENPQSVDPKLVDTPTKTVTGEFGDVEVRTEVPHTDLADVRADDPPAVAAEKMARAHERIAELQKDAPEGYSAPAPGGDIAGAKSFDSAGTNKSGDDKSAEEAVDEIYDANDDTDDDDDSDDND